MSEQSVWVESSGETDFPTLEEDISVDVAVVGGGIAGVTTAYMLQQKGIDSVLLERDRLAKGVTGNTTAKITALQEIVYSRLSSVFEAGKVKNYADANSWAISKIEEIIEYNDIDCGFQRSPAYTYATTARSRNKVKEEVEAMQKTGLEPEFVENPGLPFKTRGAVKLDRQAYFHPRKYILGVAESIKGSIFENSKVKSIDTGDPHVIRTGKGSVTARHLVLATHFPLVDRGLYFARMEPRYSYAIHVRLEEDSPDGMFINPGTDFRSLRPGAYENSLIVGGEGHPTGHGGSAANYSQLEDWARENFAVESIDYRWSTQDYSTFDHVPYIGKSPLSRRVYLATGFGGWGMTNGTVAGKLISETIFRGESRWENLYDPSRLNLFSRKVLSQLVQRNAHTAEKFVKDRLDPRPGDISSVQEEEGEVMDLDGEKIAVYRDSDGDLHILSAVCTHMNCIVSWNSAEKTWDCPCHGSRFGCKGEVIDGPAHKDLSEPDAD